MPVNVQYRVLVVDDDESIRQIYRRGFEALGMQCDIASGVPVAENMLRVRKYHAVVSDLRMPQVHGHQFIVTLLESSYKGLVFVVSGALEPRLVRDLIARGVTDVVSKPVDVPVFCMKVLAMIERDAAKRGGPSDRPPDSGGDASGEA